MKPPIHFGMLCPDVGGHANPFIALARELMRRGHRATVYTRPAGVEKFARAGIECRCFGTADFPISRSADEAKRHAELRGAPALRFTLELVRSLIPVILRELPTQFRRDGINIVVVDGTLGDAGGSVAQAIGVPYAVLHSALVLPAEPQIPPFFTTWSYSPSPWAVLRNRIASKLMGLRLLPIARVLKRERARIGLPAHEFPEPFAQIAAFPKEFDFPRKLSRPTLHFVGPIVDPAARPTVEFPFDKLDGRPIVYATLGTMLGGNWQLLEIVPEACSLIPEIQLVMSLGGSAVDQRQIDALRGNPIVVKFAPQLELLNRSAVCICHGGANTALEAIAAGVPIVAIPIMNDAPGVAARIAWTGCGEFIRLSKLSASRLRASIQRIRMDPGYREAARKLSRSMPAGGGVRRAGDIVCSAMDQAFTISSSANDWSQGTKPAGFAANATDSL